MQHSDDVFAPWDSPNISAIQRNLYLLPIQPWLARFAWGYPSKFYAHLRMFDTIYKGWDIVSSTSWENVSQSKKPCLVWKVFLASWGENVKKKSHEIATKIFVLWALWRANIIFLPVFPCLGAATASLGQWPLVKSQLLLCKFWVVETSSSPTGETIPAQCTKEEEHRAMCFVSHWS